MAIPVDKDGYSKCTMYDVNYTEIILNGIRDADPSWPTRGCSHGWEFDFSDIPYETVATEVRMKRITDHEKRRLITREGADKERRFSSPIFSLSAFATLLEHISR